MARLQSLRPALALVPTALFTLTLASLLAGPLAAQEAHFRIDPEQLTLRSLGANTAGLVGWRSSPRLLGMMNDTGVRSAPYRRMLRLNDVAGERYIGEDFSLAESHGLYSWLTVVGTPRFLSPDPNAEGNQYGTGVPEYARYPPTDPIAWADELLAFIDDMEANYGVVPDYVEIWNEPERVEWFKGTGTDLLELYGAASKRIRSARPGIRIGGPGLAGWRSEMGMGESMLLALVRQAKASRLPLDFVSWHHYANSTELLYSKMPELLRNLGRSLGMPSFQTIVSEWNIYPSAEGTAGLEFDGPHGASNLGGFLISARLAGLDHGLFFHDQDEPDTPRITDLLGIGMGLVSEHGIRKPSIRLLETLQDMAQLPEPQIQSPPEEWNIRVTAAMEGDVMRIVVTNDVITGLWVFANRAREHGMNATWLYDIWLAAGGSQADEQDLINAGLTPEQAQATLSFIPEVLLYGRYRDEPRPVELEILGNRGFSLGPATRFTLTVNAPAQHQAALMPSLEAAESAAEFTSAYATALNLVAAGYLYTAADILAIPGDFFVWAANEGILYGHAIIAYKVLQDSLRNDRLTYHTQLNNLPQTVVTSESPTRAGLSIVGREIRFMMEPNTSIVIVVEPL